MGVNSYLLNQLYANGIIDYVPDLGQAGIGMMNGMQNPYMNMAMQGAGYKNYGMGHDTFTMASRPGVGDVAIGSQTQAHKNMFGLKGIGFQSNARKNMFGEQGIGSQTNTGISNLYGQKGIGDNTNTGIVNSYGGFSDISNRVSGTVASVKSAPAIIKGLASAGIIWLTFTMLFKGKKKPPKTQQGFWAKLFHKKPPVEEPKKGFFARLFGGKKG